MKKKILCLAFLALLLLIISFSQAQNLVANCSFEQYDTCPDNQGQIERATGWFKTYGAADYYNSCSTGAWTVPPPVHPQLAATGNAFVGLNLFGEQVGGVEVIHTVLSSPLTAGITYYVSFKVNLCINPAAFMNEAIDKIGARFTTGTPPFIDNIAQVYTNTVITDTTNWTTISGSFVADSAFTHMYIGIFFDTAHVNSVILAPSGIDRAYYFIDDVCVSPNPSEICSGVGIEEASNESAFILYPNPARGELRIKNAGLRIEKVEINNAFSTNVLPFSRERRGLGEELINVSSFPPGIYFITLTDEKKNRITKRFVKM